jgi:hypothetical protein
MASFKDSSGKEYNVRLTVKTWRHVKEKTSVDLAGDFQKSILLLHSDPLVFCNVLYHLVQDQHQGDEESFADLLDGQTLEAARNAVVSAVIDFFPNQNQRATAAEMVKRADALAEKVGTKAKLTMDQKATEFENRINEASTESFGTLLADLEGSIRGLTPSAN